MKVKKDTKINIYKKCFGNNSNLHIPKVGISGGIAVLERINITVARIMGNHSYLLEYTKL